MSVMSVAMILAARPRWLEPLPGGLDISYRLHKWLGISALVLSLIHWLGANGPRWMVQTGLLERGGRQSKSENRPLNLLEDRMAVITALGCVDAICSFDSNTPLELIN